jgi:LEA14-like dessication related protein
MERRLRRLTWGSRLRLIFTLVILLGVGLHLGLVYHAASSLELVDERLDSVVPVSADTYEVSFTLTLDNPTSISVEVDHISYDVYVEDDFAGAGERSGFSLDPGKEELSLSLTFSGQNLSGPALTLLTQGGAMVTIKGDVTIPAKFLGLFTWRHLTLPYEVEERVDSGEEDGGGLDDPPPVPVSLFEPVYVPPDGARLDWSPNIDTDFDRYEVHTSPDALFEPSSATLAGTLTDREETTLTVTGLDHLSEHYFLVRVYDDAGGHSDSNIMSLWMP